MTIIMFLLGTAFLILGNLGHWSGVSEIAFYGNIIIGNIWIVGSIIYSKLETL